LLIVVSTLRGCNVWSNATMKKAVERTIHVLLFSLTIHVWHMVTSDRMLDAYADVGLDHGLQMVEHISHIAGE
jgi:hypothetical protein